MIQHIWDKIYIFRIYSPICLRKPDIVSSLRVPLTEKQKKIHVVHSVMKPTNDFHIFHHIHMYWNDILLPSMDMISMRQCKKDVTPLLMHWIYIFLVLTHRYDTLNRNSIFCPGSISTTKYHLDHPLHVPFECLLCVLWRKMCINICLLLKSLLTCPMSLCPFSPNIQCYLTSPDYLDSHS